MKATVSADGFTVQCRQKDWGYAGFNSSIYRQTPPDGYKLIRSVITRRKPTGIAVNLSLEFEWIDDRVNEMTHAEVLEHFSHLEPFRGPRVLAGSEQSPQ